MKVIDSHCHLVDDKVLPVVESVLERAKLAGVEKFITMAGGRAEWPKLSALADKFSEVYVAYGWHPEDITKVEDLDDLEKLLTDSPKAVAIGEAGLDFFYDKEKKTKELQMTMLRKQVELAIKLEKKIVLHVRSAEEEMIEVMSEYKGAFKAHFHCFGESPDLLATVVSEGHMVSFGGNVTFKSAQNLRDMVKTVPVDQLLLETDTPYLSPEPKRGTQNEPANIIYTAHLIAKELKIEVEELADVTYRNTLCFFGLEN